MEKRLPLALFLSFLVIMTWSIVSGPREKRAPGEGPAEASEAGAAEGPGPAIEVAEEPPPPVGEVLVDEEERTLELEFDAPGSEHRFHAVFSNRGARLLELRLGDFFDRGDLSEAERIDIAHWEPLLSSIETPAGATGSLVLEARTSAEPLLRGTPLELALWTMEPLEEEGRAVGVEFRYAPGSGVTFLKRVWAFPERHALEVELGLRNDSSEDAGPRQFRFTPALVMPRALADRFYIEPKAVAAWSEPGRQAELESKDRKDSPGRDLVGALGGGKEFSFAGTHNKYFAFLLRPHPDDPASRAAIQGAGYRRIYDSGWAAENPGQEDEAWGFVVTDLELRLQLPERGQEVTRRFAIYAGTKARDELVEAWPAHQLIIDKDLGFFSGISKIILAILGFYERIVGNWGWAIVLMTLTVRALLFPVNRRMQTSMARYQTKMKRIQPKLDEIKKTLEKDPQKLRQEQARIMQEEGAFPPLGGCLPMLLQIPVFIGLFAALRVVFELRQAPFGLWIQDLSQPDRLLYLGVKGLPLLGDMLEYLNVLPILMVVLWVWQQRSMPTPTDEQQARMQRMMAFMPVLFGFFLYNYAAGLSVYMITSSGMGIFETKVIKKVWPVDDTEAPKKRSGFMSRLGELQKEQSKRMEQLQHQQRSQQQRARGARKGKRGKKRAS